MSTEQTFDAFQEHISVLAVNNLQALGIVSMTDLLGHTELELLRKVRRRSPNNIRLMYRQGKLKCIKVKGLIVEPAEARRWLAQGGK